MSRKQIIIWVSVWWLALWCIIGLTVNYFPFRPTFPYARERLPQYGPREITTLAHFDGVHYLTIAAKGYFGTGLIQAFFPMYPLAVKGLSIDGRLNPVVIGEMISMVSFMGALLILSKLIAVDESTTTTRRTILLMLVFPTSFYFMGVYSESLFLLFCALAFWWGRKGSWWLAGLAGMAAAATRVTGVFLVIGLMIEWYLQTRRRPVDLIACCVPGLGLAGYMVYLTSRFGDPWLFYRVQKDFGAAREAGRLILLPQVFWRYGKMIIGPHVDFHAGYLVWLELMAGLTGLILSIAAFFKTRPSYAVFAVLSFILPTLTGTFSSLPRYLLPLFPLFIVAAKIIPSKIYPLVLILSGILLVINLIFFTQGMWVA